MVVSFEGGVVNAFSVESRNVLKLQDRMFSTDDNAISCMSKSKVLFVLLLFDIMSESTEDMFTSETAKVSRRLCKTVQLCSHCVRQQPDFKRNTNLCFRRAHFWSTCEYLGVLESNPEYL